MSAHDRIDAVEQWFLILQDWFKQLRDRVEALEVRVRELETLVQSLRAPLLFDPPPAAPLPYYPPTFVVPTPSNPATFTCEVKP